MNSMEYLDNMKDPRTIKTHLFCKNLPKHIREGGKTPKVLNQDAFINH